MCRYGYFWKVTVFFMNAVLITYYFPDSNCMQNLRHFICTDKICLIFMT